MPHVALSLRVDAAARPLGFTIPPAPEVHYTFFRRLGQLDALQLWLLAVGLFLCSLGTAASVVETFGLKTPPAAPQVTRSWLQHAVANALRLEPPPPPPGPAIQSLPLLCGALLLLIASHTPLASRRLTAMLLALWAAAQTLVAVRALWSEPAQEAVRRLRFHCFVTCASLLFLFAAPVVPGKSGDSEPTDEGVVGDVQVAAEAFATEFQGTEETYR
jgi:hypothetical protein